MARKNKELGKSYRRKWQSDRVKKVKHILIQFLGGCCYECGYSGCDDALDFHHKDASQKEKGISDLLTGRFERVLDEAKKCVLLCCRCHREKHSSDGSLGPNKLHLKEV